MIKFFINNDTKHLSPEISYLLNVWAKNQEQKIVFTDNPDNAATVGSGDDNTLVVSRSFGSAQTPGIGQNEMVEDERGRPDLLTTAFYLMNSLQEYNDTDRDELGRFRFVNSYQYRFNNTKENIVQRCFHEISKAIRLTPRIERSRFFLSHDIDLINGAILEDGFNVLRKGRIDILFGMLFNVAMGKPDWLNMDKIMKLESEYDCRSIFYWLVKKGKINSRERNADYDFSSANIKRQFRLVEENGFENGLHKSIGKDSFDDEFIKYGKRPVSNRYHYLKFHVPEAYHDIETAGLQLDTSLGFAEQIGFRNSYGAPFSPYNFVTRKAFSFLEAPLHIMDRTFFQYKKYPADKAWDDILDFFEKNRENSVISILWHNNFFTNYKFKGYPGLYRKILSYIRDNNFRSISVKEIIKKYSILNDK